MFTADRRPHSAFAVSLWLYGNAESRILLVSVSLVGGMVLYVISFRMLLNFRFERDQEDKMFLIRSVQRDPTPNLLNLTNAANGRKNQDA